MMKLSNSIRYFRYSIIAILLFATAQSGGAKTLPATPPNAFDIYIKAGQTLVRTEDIREFSAALRTSKPPTAASIHQILDDNKEALNMLRLGFRHKYQHPTIKAFDTPTTNYLSFRDLTRLLMLKGALKERRGDKTGAAASYVDGIRLGVDIPKGGGYLAYLMGFGIEALSRRHLRGIINQMDAATAKGVIRRLETISTRRETLANIIEVEGQIILASLPQAIMESDEESGRQYAVLTPIIIQNCRRWLDTTIANYAKPYALRTPVPLPIDPVSQTYLSYLNSAGYFEARNIAGNSLATVALALQAHHKLHGKYPEKLESLKGEILREIPPDPFGSGEKLHYRLQENRCLLYSIGPDITDNGGIAIISNKRRGHRRYAIDISSKGDFVSGINY